MTKIFLAQHCYFPFRSVFQLSQLLNMSGGLDVFALTEDEAMKFIVCETHIGTKNLDFQMENYMYKRRPDGNLIMLQLEIIFRCPHHQYPQDMGEAPACGTCHRCNRKSGGCHSRLGYAFCSASTSQGLLIYAYNL